MHRTPEPPPPPLPLQGTSYPSRDSPLLTSRPSQTHGPYSPTSQSLSPSVYPTEPSSYPLTRLLSSTRVFAVFASLYPPFKAFKTASKQPCLPHSSSSVSLSEAPCCPKRHAFPSSSSQSPRPYNPLSSSLYRLCLLVFVLAMVVLSSTVLASPFDRPSRAPSPLIIAPTVHVASHAVGRLLPRQENDGASSTSSTSTGASSSSDPTTSDASSSAPSTSSSTHIHFHPLLAPYFLHSDTLHSDTLYYAYFDTFYSNPFYPAHFDALHSSSFNAPASFYPLFSPHFNAASTSCVDVIPFPGVCYFRVFAFDIKPFYAFGPARLASSPNKFFHNFRPCQHAFYVN
ncbi:hypothetical protein EIP91_006577 [Steccherinum ochraceum]|uniref:Uncharacterized protein n=1 Tax=Steccherinum ochraceum TaxID=92696 RepID=A0A4R0RBA5_9APHY|nr:hypothetical protein EIP91_006577 [Steccherinum ochraceum]